MTDIFEWIVLNPTLITAIATVILAIITLYYASEMRKMRLEAIKPVFSLRSDLYTISGESHGLLLLNDGGTAKNVEIDIKINKKVIEMFHSPSINKGEVVDLRVDPTTMEKLKNKLEISLKYQDSYNRNLEDNLVLDYSTDSMKKRKVAYRYIPKENILKNIERKLK